MFKIMYSQNNAPQQQVVSKDNPSVLKKYVAGITGGAIVALPQTYIMKRLSLGFQNGLSAINKTLSKDEVQILNQTGEKSLMKAV